MRDICVWIRGMVGFVLLGMMGMMGGCSAGGGGREDSVAGGDSIAYQPDFYQEWKKVGRLDFGQMTVTKTVTTDRTEWYKIGKRVAVYSFDIYLKAGMDLDKLGESDVVVDEASKTIRLHLPPVEVRETGRSSDLRLEYEHIDLFRSRPDSRERAQLKEMASADFHKEMKRNPVYLRQLQSTAEEKARAYFTALGEAAGYRVEFTDALPVHQVEN